jgi:hypothetical protein
MRGERKTTLRPMTELLSGFKTGNNRKTIAFNHKLAEDLKEGTSFASKVCVPNHSYLALILRRISRDRKACTKAPIPQRGANTMWFVNRRDEGPNHPEYFSPFPYQGLATILTAACISIRPRTPSTNGSPVSGPTSLSQQTSIEVCIKPTSSRCKTTRRTPPNTVCLAKS